MGSDSDVTETNDGRININTAPLCVVRSLLPPDELSFSVIEKIDDFRRRSFEEDFDTIQNAFSAFDDDDDDLGEGDGASQ